MIWVSTGTPRAGVVADGDTLRSSGQTDFEAATGQLATVSKELPAIIGNVKVLTAEARTAQGTLAGLGVEGRPVMRDVSKTASRVMDEMSSRWASLGPLFTGTEPLSVRARRALARTDSLRVLLTSERRSFGRFRRDSTLRHEVGVLRNELAALRALAAQPDGTLGRVASDSVLRQSLDNASRQMDSLFADLRKHPLRYIAF